jgi:hypothetical protein
MPTSDRKIISTVMGRFMIRRMMDGRADMDRESPGSAANHQEGISPVYLNRLAGRIASLFPGKVHLRTGWFFLNQKEGCAKKNSRAL